MTRLRILLSSLIFTLGLSGAQAAELVIGVPDWPSAQATAHILKVVMEERLGVAVTLKPSTNQQIFEGMDEGTMQVHPEVWLPNQASLYTRYVEGRRSARMSPYGVDATQGVCTTRATAAAHKISALSDLARPEIAGIFDTDFDGKGEIWIGAADWASTQEMIRRASATGFDKTMTLLQAPEQVALAAVDIAAATGKPLVFYCYTPHHVFALHDLVRLDEQPADNFAVASGSDGAPGPGTNQPAGWNDARFHITYASSLAQSAPDVEKVLRRVRLDSDTVTALTYALVVERQDPAEFARVWVKQNKDRIDQWVQ